MALTTARARLASMPGGAPPEAELIQYSTLPDSTATGRLRLPTAVPVPSMDCVCDVASDPFTVRARDLFHTFWLRY